VIRSSIRGKRGGRRGCTPRYSCPRKEAGRPILGIEKKKKRKSRGVVLLYSLLRGRGNGMAGGGWRKGGEKGGKKKG